MALAMIGGWAALVAASKRAAFRRLAGVPKFSEWDYRAVEPAVEQRCRPAIFWPEHMERVKACGFGRTVGGEVAKLGATSFVTTPAEIAELRDVLVVGGHVFHGNGRNLLKDTGLFEKPLSRFGSFESVVVPNTFVGLHFFGHWLRDDCSGFELARARGRVVSVARPDFRDAPCYEGLFDQPWEDMDGFSAKTATFVSDIGFSPAKAERLRALRARLRARLAGRTRPEIVFIRRGVRDPLRNPLNETVLVDRLSKEGVRVVDVGQKIEDVLSDILDAEIIIGLEGSQMAHAVHLLREGGGVIVLQSPFRFYNPHHEWARLLDMRYGTIVGTAVEDGFEMDIGEVMRMIDQVRSALRDRTVL